MTHTLHRIKKEHEKENDFVILAMPARGINNKEGMVEKLSKFVEIFNKNNAVNIGGMGTGQLTETSVDEILNKIYSDMPMVHGVFDNRDSLIGALKDIKKADIGISIIVSGQIDEVNECAKEAGLTRHSVNYSLGIWGDTSRLPEEDYLEISTMCGHAMVSPNYIKKIVSDIRRNKLTIEEAAIELSRPCVCGIFNPKKAKEILKRIV